MHEILMIMNINTMCKKKVCKINIQEYSGLFTMAGVFTMAGDSEQLIIFSIFALVCLRLLRQLWHSF